MTVEISARRCPRQVAATEVHEGSELGLSIDDGANLQPCDVILLSEGNNDTDVPVNGGTTRILR